MPLVPQTEFVFDSLGQIVYLCGLAQPGEAPLKDVVPPPLFLHPRVSTDMELSMSVLSCFWLVSLHTA